MFQSATVESLPLRQSSSKPIEQRELDCIGLMHHMTAMFEIIGVVADTESKAFQDSFCAGDLDPFYRHG